MTQATMTMTPPTNRPSWYVINKAGPNDEAEIRIYEDIGFLGVTAKQFADDLEEIKATTIHVRLNTYGGEAFDGIAIHNALKAHPAKIVVHIDGIAASAGSIVAMSGDEIRMANNAFVMIHESQGGVYGEADDMRNYAEILDKLNDGIAITYQGRAGKTRKYWREKMAVETWFTADEAQTEGLVDQIEEPVETAKNRFDFKIFNHVPPEARKAWAKPEQSATVDSPRGEPEPVAPFPERSQQMPDSIETIPTAQPPAAVIQGNAGSAPVAIESTLGNLRASEIQSYIEQGRRAGLAEGQAAERDRMRAIIDACPGDAGMAISAFVGKQTPEAVRLAFDAANKARAEADTMIAAMKEENARQVALAAAGGYAGGVGGFVATDDDVEDRGPLDKETAKAHAATEWDRNTNGCRKGFSSKESYVNFRYSELTNQFQGYKQQVARA